MKRLWYECLRNLQPRFLRQRPIGDYIVDFYCSKQRLVIEVDGGTHVEAAAQSYDAARTEALGKLGLRVLRFTNQEVLQDFETVRKRIEAEVRLST